MLNPIFPFSGLSGNSAVVFASGFLFGMSRKKELKECGHLASVASAEVISHYGARPLVKLSSLI